MLVGYARVSTEEQSLNRQIDMLVDYGVDKRNIYQEKISGMKSNRDQLDRMIDERVSTEEQSLNRQIDMLVDYGVDKRNIYQEKISGMKSNRDQLDRMIDELQEGDTVIITDLTRISRSTKDPLNIIDRIKTKGTSIKSIKDTWLDTSSDNPYNSFLLTVMSGLSQLERDLISQRTKEGLKSAKARGRNGGRPSKRNDKSDTVGLLYKEGYKIVDIVKQTGLSRATVYRVLKDLGLKE